MTLAEAIRHAQEQAQQLHGTSKADEHRQLALWLQELQERRDRDPLPLEKIACLQPHPALSTKCILAPEHRGLHEALHPDGCSTLSWGVLEEKH